MDDEQELQLLRKEASKIVIAQEVESMQMKKKQRWIARNWPEIKEIADDTAKCISEGFIRMDEENCEDTVQDLVRRSLDGLYSSAEASVPDITTLKSMPDVELLKALPTLIGSLSYVQVLSLFKIVTGASGFPRKCKHGVGRALLRSVAAASMLSEDVPDSLRRAAEVLRGFVTVPPKPSLFLPQAPQSPMDALRMALEKLEELPHRCIQVMRDVLYGRTGVRGKRLTNNCPDLRDRVRRRTATLLQQAVLTEMVSILPEEVEKAIRVVSAYAVEEYGNDGGLSQSLGSLPAETEALQKKLLSAIALVGMLSFEDLKNIYETIMPTEERRTSSMRHPRVYRYSLKGALRELLYRCSAETFPEAAKQALEMIATCKPCTGKPSSSSSHPDPELRIHHLRRETEALQNLSGHLQQVSWEWIEGSGITIDEEPTVVQASNPAQKRQKTEHNARVKLEKQPPQPPQQRVARFSFEDDDDESLEEVSRDVALVADDGACIAYVVIGHALDKSGIAPQGSAYLKSGLDPSENSSGKLNEDPEVDLILRVIECLPNVSQSVLRKVQARMMDL